MFVRQNDFDVLKARYLSWAAAGFPEGDQNILPVLRALNEVPGVTTTSSCESHLGRENALQKFYITMAVTQEGYEVVLKIFESLYAELDRKFALYMDQSNMKLRGMGFRSVSPQNLALTMTRRNVRLEDDRLLWFFSLQLVALEARRSPQKQNFINEFLRVVQAHAPL